MAAAEGNRREPHDRFPLHRLTDSISRTTAIRFKCSMEFLANQVKTIVGLRPSFSAQVRWGEPGAPVDCLRRCYATDSEVLGTLRQIRNSPAREG